MLPVKRAERGIIMNKKELIERLEWLDKQEFLLQMKDRWDADDYRTACQWQDEMRKIKEMLAEM